MDRELPWHLAESEVWTELIAPYLSQQINLQLDALCSATTNDERAVIQGRLQVLKAIGDAPSFYAQIKAFDARMKEQQEKLADGPRERRRSLARPVKRTR